MFTEIHHPFDGIVGREGMQFSLFLFADDGLESQRNNLRMNTTIEEALSGIANQLRIDSIVATTAAGSGHPSSCCSAADIVAALFFGHMRFDPKNPKYPNNDRFILSKGHAAP